MPGILLAVFAAACQPLLSRLTEVSWEATALLVVGVGPWALLLLIDPHPTRALKRGISALTVALLLVGAAIWGLAALPEGGGNGRCSPDYEGTCVPVDEPDVDCADLQIHGFRSVGRDPYGLDTDGDGIACE